MTITASDIKIGMCVEMDGKTFIVVDFQHCKPGKGPAFVRSKLKNLMMIIMEIYGRYTSNTRIRNLQISP